MASSTRSGDRHIPKFQSTQSLFTPVTGGHEDAPGTFVCKWGRTTSATCGYIDAGEYYDSPYGYFRKVSTSSSYPIMNSFGDSGGPVHVGNLAVGTVHGKDSADNLYFGPLWRWDAGNIGFQVACSPCG